MMRLRFLAVMLPLGALLAQPPSQPADKTELPTVEATLDTEIHRPDVPAGKVVLTVGPNKLTVAQFDQVAGTLSEQYRNIARGAGRKQFADNLVRIMLLAQEAKAQQLGDDEELRTQIEFARNSLLATRMLAKITPDEAEERKYYESHKGEYEQVRARHILIRMADSGVPVKPGQKDLSKEEARAKAQEIRKKLVAGADFADMAVAESADGSAASGGDLGSFGRGQMVPSFEDAAFALEPGKISEPVETKFGYHLIQVQSKRVVPFDEVRKDIEAALRPAATEKLVNDLKKKYEVSIDAEFFDTSSK
jgi:peptidyl-prolyl cis-trans isomerase C